MVLGTKSELPIFQLVETSLGGKNASNLKNKTCEGNSQQSTNITPTVWNRGSHLYSWPQRSPGTEELQGQIKTSTQFKTSDHKYNLLFQGSSLGQYYFCFLHRNVGSTHNLQVQCCFTSRETMKTEMGRAGQPPWLSHSSWTLMISIYISFKQTYAS